MINQNNMMFSNRNEIFLNDLLTKIGIPEADDDESEEDEGKHDDEQEEKKEYEKDETKKRKKKKGGQFQGNVKKEK